MAKPRFLRNGAEINSLVSQIKEAYEDKKAVIDGLNIMNLYIYIFFIFLHLISSLYVDVLQFL